MRAARLVAVIDVAADPAGKLPAELLTAAYRASAVGPVAFVLGPADFTSVDRVLDSAVHRTLAVHGVRYCTLDDVSRLMAETGPPLLAVARTEALRSALAALGVEPLHEDDAIAALHDLEKRTGDRRPSSRPRGTGSAHAPEHEAL